MSVARWLAILLLASSPAAAQSPQKAADSVVFELLPTSRLEVQTGKAGVLGFAGHDHRIRAKEFSGHVVVYPGQPAASHVRVLVATDSLEVLTPPDTEEIRKVTAAMRDEVLDVAHFPEITLTARGVRQTGDTLLIDAVLTMKGHSRTMPVAVRVGLDGDTLRAAATFSAKQTDFGIRPYRGGPGGTVRVADKVVFTIEAVAVRRP